MNKKPYQSPLQPAHHESHGLADRGGYQTHSDATPNIARDSKVGKHVTQVHVAWGQTKITKSGQAALGGDHASALDSLSGLTIVPGKHGAEATAQPLVKPPVEKRLTQTRPTWGNKDGDGRSGGNLHDLGAAVLAEAMSGHRGKNFK
jgi:hypothetical protein